MYSNITCACILCDDIDKNPRLSNRVDATDDHEKTGAIDLDVVVCMHVHRWMYLQISHKSYNVI